jgi:hypothetical protein
MFGFGGVGLFWLGGGGGGGVCILTTIARCRPRFSTVCFDWLWFCGFEGAGGWAVVVGVDVHLIGVCVCVRVCVCHSPFPLFPHFFKARKKKGKRTDTIRREKKKTPPRTLKASSMSNPTFHPITQRPPKTLRQRHTKKRREKAKNRKETNAPGPRRSRCGGCRAGGAWPRR